VPRRYRLPTLLLDPTGVRIPGHDDLVTPARTYTHVVADEREVDYAELLT